MKSSLSDLDKKLAKEGWERRSLLSEPRLSEIVQQYSDLGFEVHLESVQSVDPDTGCDACFTSGETSQIVYTRRRK